MKDFADYRDYRAHFEYLVELEREEEMERHRSEIENLSGREREKKGRAVLRMKGKDQGKGLGGSHIIKFTRSGRDGDLPDTEITVGDLIMVSKNQPANPDNPTGTVIEKTNYSISVAFDEKPHGFVYGKGLRVDLYVNDITFQRMLDALESFEEVKGGKKRLRDILVGEREPDFGKGKEDLEVNNDKLNESQKRAVRRSLEAEEIFLIHGPPGTGKTTTLIEAVEQHIDQGMKVLATADSNVAVDNLVDFLNERGRNAVRVGHPARVTESLREHTLDFIVEKKEKYRKAQELREKAYRLDDEQEKHTYPSGRWRRGLSDEAIKGLAEDGKGSRGIPPDKIKSMAKWLELQDQIGDLIEQAEELEDEAVDEIIDSADVVCTTNSTAGSELMEGRNFDVVMIDEATQATEPSCLIAMDHADKAVMAGDHRQLPPTILNQEAMAKGLEETLFERLVTLHGSAIKEMLDTQYRMNTDIMQFSDDEFYHGDLKADESVADHTLDISVDGEDLAEMAVAPENPVVFVDTGGTMRERSRKDSTSKENPGEAELVERIVERLIELGVKAEDIGVISPYDDQVDLIKQKLDVEGLEVKTVDGFQGREKEVIVLSFVRSNSDGVIGFLEDLRRLNVAITRARKKLVMVGDTETLSSHATYEKLANYVRDTGRVMKSGDEEKKER
ncbi:MAG: IGHMBP2 family helicase [Candidatus Nanohaloarchaea archaeon]|nr:IGHMBP2 family helicase [Candidatus Nanohaloarchaea archaeon]